MKHKLSVLSVVLAFLALVFVLTACGNDSNITAESAIKPRTITIYSITGESTTPEAIQKVQDELNKITESLYKVHVVLKLYPEDEYEAALKTAIAANENGEVVSNVSTSDTVSTEVVTNEYGRPLTIYPEAKENQLDIFLIPEGVEKFDYYTQTYFNTKDEATGTVIDKGGVALNISSELNENGVGYVLNQYIPSRVLNFCRENPADASTALYGIPSNRYYGEAEYMLVNKALFDEYHYDPATITDMYSLEGFLNDLAEDCGEGKRPDTVPLYNTPSMNLVSLTGTNSVVAQQVSNSAVIGMSYTPKNILAIPSVQKAMNFISTIHQKSLIMPRVTNNVDFDTEFGVAFLYASADAVSKYSDDYYVILNRVPLVESQELYKGIYAVSNYASDDVDRCIQILTCMNTNAEFRNIFGYGVENYNYIIDEETGLVVPINDSYVMDLEATGNMFLLMQNSSMTEKEMSLSDNNWAVAKATNNLAIVSPYAKFVLNAPATESAATFAPVYQVAPELEKLYDELWTLIAEFPTYVNPNTGEKLNGFTEYLPVLEDMLNQNVYVSSALSDTNTNSIVSQYTTWFEAQ